MTMKSLVALLTLTAASMLTASNASAQTYSGAPVCLHVYGPASYYDCRFTSIAQCNATASGRAAQCVVNPYMANAGMNGYRTRQRAY
jgi:hypothetical protein